MTDDPSGRPTDEQRFLPEMPVPGSPAVPPPVTPPPPGTPPPGSLKPSGSDSWRWYFAVYAFVGALIAGQIAILVVSGIWVWLSDKTLTQLSDGPGFIVIASAINELFFVATAVFVARLSGAFRWRDFGLLRAPLRRTVVLTGVVTVSYFVFLAVYSQLFQLAPDDAPEKLGADGSDLQMLFFALLVAVLAPIAEEIFFRGMIFRALWNGIGLWPAAIVSGLLFGSLHFDELTSERVLQVIPIAVLGISFALLYAWSGTLYSAIALHATNNAVAVAAFAEKNNSDFGLVLAGVLWVAMMIGCGFGHRLTDKRSNRPPTGLSDGGDGPVEYALPR